MNIAISILDTLDTLDILTSIHFFLFRFPIIRCQHPFPLSIFIPLHIFNIFRITQILYISAPLDIIQISIFISIILSYTILHPDIP